MNSMNFIVFDLEWNQPEGIPKEERVKLPFEIIEIGAVKLNAEGKLVSKFSRLIKPVVYDRINWRIKKMLQLKPGELESGKSFKETAEEFLTWCGDDYIFCTWGGQDLTELQRNMAYFDMPPLSERPIRYLDVQKIYARMNGVRNQISLETAVDALGIVKDVAFHRAFSDAYYTSKILALIPAQIINSVYAYDLYSLPVEDKEELHIRDEDSYTYYSRRYEAKEDILKKQKILAVKCPVCGATLKRKIKWFGHAGRPLHSGAVCPEHRYVAGVLKIRQGETGGYFAEKNVKLVTEEEFNELKERRDKNSK